MLETGQLMQLMQAPDPDAWRQALFLLVRNLNFNQVLYAVVQSRHTQFERAFLQSNYSPAWRARYDAERLAYVDPTVRHCLTSSLPFMWEPASFTTRDGQHVHEEAAAYGIRSGITLPIHGPNGELGMLSLASDMAPGSTFTRDINHAMSKLTLIRDYAFASALPFSTQPAAEAPPRLTRRELEVLNWVMAGKSSWEISMITRCSEATINFHLANVRVKFKVGTRQQAVVKAISLGLINPEDHYR